jgi:hypothetical protein
MRNAVRISLLCAASSGCVSAGEAVRNRASYDFGCPKEEIRADKLTGAGITFAAHGCGKKAVYVWNGHAWSRDSEISPDR